VTKRKSRDKSAKLLRKEGREREGAATGDARTAGGDADTAGEMTVSARGHALLAASQRPNPSANANENQHYAVDGNLSIRTIY